MTKFFIAVLWVASSLTASHFQQISSLEEVSWDLPEKTLVMFDVDEVLLTPEDLLLKEEGWDIRNKHWSKFEDSIAISHTNYVLVDPAAPQIIRSLQERNHITIAFTACSTGEHGTIDSLENWRFDRLKKHGIDFSRSLSEIHEFFELVSSHQSPPRLVDGILYCGDLSDPEGGTRKGTLFSAFLDKLSWKPELIVFVDDKLRHVKAVQSEAEKRGIPCIGIHFPQKEFTLDEEIARIQIRTMLEKKEWISDKAAKAELP